MADQARATNHNFQAEVAYKRVIDCYKKLGEDVKRLRQNLILKAGRFFEENEYRVQAAKCYVKIFDDLHILLDDIHMKLPGDVHMADSSIDIPIHHAIRNFDAYGHVSQDAVRGIIRCCSLYLFGSRNRYMHTPLHLAVFSRNEEISVAIMSRIKDPLQEFRINPTHLNTRDLTSQTLLTTAVLSKCSIPLITDLIQCGSNVNPVHWENSLLTPLQAASTPGIEYVEAAVLLKQNHADTSHVCLDSTVAELFTANGWIEHILVPMSPGTDPSPNTQHDHWT